MEPELRFLHRLHQRLPDDVDIMLPLADQLTRAGLHQEGLAVDARLAACLPDDPVVRYNLACSLALCGQPGPALDALEAAVRLGYHEADHLREDADLVSLHGHVRFHAILAGLEAPTPRAPETSG